jgi:hypothetical protein
MRREGGVDKERSAWTTKMMEQCAHDTSTARASLAMGKNSCAET